MSNLLYMDESNGNGVYAVKSNSSTTATSQAAATATNNINNIMMAATTTAAAAAAAAVAAGATTTTTLPTSVSNEDLSQSLSEYTDADESISAPTEFLAEFLSAVMLKDYKKALKYCKLILQYEPHNATAKEFYPLILDKLRGATSSDSDENYNKSSSPELVLELQSSDPSAGESDEAGSSDHQRAGDEVGGAVGGGDYEVEEDAGGDEFGLHEDNYNSSGEPHSHATSNSSCGSAVVSLSESVDDEEDDDEEEEVDDDDDEDEDDDEDDDVISSSGDDLPIDDHQHLMDSGGDDDGICGAVGEAAAVSAGSNGSHNSSRNSSSGGGGRSRSDNTTHSYSSLLLEEDDDIVAVNLHFPKDLSAPDLDVSNGNKIPSASCSDSESPTEPLTQRLAAILRSKCGVSNADAQY